MKHFLGNVEFYITNVCNYNCDNCNRFNNYYFSGHQLWKDYAEIYEAWSQRLDLGTITILGGEPMLNPSLREWLYGIRKLWPTTPMLLISNGTRLHYWDNFYQTLLDNRVDFRITAHNRNRYDDIINDVTTLLKTPFTRTYMGDLTKWNHAYNQVKDSSWPECNNANEFEKLPKHIQEECKNVHKIDPQNFLKNTNDVQFVDCNGVTITVTYAEHFVTAPLKYIGNNQFQVYNSNPIEAHDVCISKYCHHFIRGKIYKCHHVGLLPEFLEQFQVNMTDAEKKLLNDYRPLTVDADDSFIKEFIDTIKNVIPQCQLCPSKLVDHLLHSSTNKPKIIKIQKRRDNE